METFEIIKYNELEMKTAKQMITENIDGLFELIDDSDICPFYEEVIELMMEEYANQSKWISDEEIDKQAENQYYKTEDFSMSDEKIRFGQKVFKNGAKWMRGQLLSEPPKQ